MSKDFFCEVVSKTMLNEDTALIEFLCPEIAKEADVKEMWLTHYSPALVHPEQYADIARDIFPNTVISRDGQFVDLMFEEEEQ